MQPEGCRQTTGCVDPVSYTHLAALTDTTVAQRLHAVQRLQAGLLYAGKFLALLDAVIPDNTVQFLSLIHI